MNASQTSRDIAQTVLECDSTKEIARVQIGQGNWRNELLLFVKPEVFMVGDPELAGRSLDLIFGKLKAFDAQVSGISAVAGGVLDEKEIMARHYGFINKLSRFASTMLSEEDRKQIADALHISPG